MSDNTLASQISRKIYATLHHKMAVTGTEAQELYDHAAQAAVSIIEQRVRELEEERSFVWKWVERGMFDKHTEAYNALEVMAYYPGAPWKNGRWDVDHKPYAAKFYETFPNAAITTKETDGLERDPEQTAAGR